MVQVDRASTPPAAPTRRSNAVWVLVVIAALLAIDGLVPWERWCRDASSGFTKQCFHASVWSGTASIEGLGVEVLAIVFVVLALWKGWAGSGRLTLPGAALATGFLGLAWTKAVLVLGDGGKTAAVSGDRLDPAAVGTWLALALAVVGVLGLIAALVVVPRSRGAVAVVAVASVVIAALGAGYASSGLAWWGGPLAPPVELIGGGGEGATAPVGDPQAFAGQMYMRNDGPWTATLDGLDVVDADSGFRVVGMFVFPGGSCPPIGVGPARILRPRCLEPVAGTRIPPGSTVELGIVAETTSTGIHRGGWMRIRYHVGPLHFEVFRTDLIYICTPKPGHKSCPGF